MAMFLNKSVKLRLAVSLGVCIALLVIVAALGNFSASRVQDDLRKTYTHNLLPIKTLGEVRTTLLMNRIVLNGMLIDRDVSKVERVTQEMAANSQKINESWAKYKQISVPNDAEKAGVASFEQHIDPLRDEIRKVQALAAAGSFDQATLMMGSSVRESYGALIADLSQVIEANVAQADASFIHGNKSYATMRNLSFGAMAFSVMLALALAVWLIRGIVTPLSKARALAESLANGNLDNTIDITSKDEFGDMLNALKIMEGKLSDVVRSVRRNAESVNLASGEIALGNDDLNRRTQEQAASLEETAASMEEITTTVRQNADNAVQADHLVQGVSRQAQQGGEVVQQAVSAMTEISTSSRKIASIVSLIDEIAFQTNLLALNAAVEAARAGEQGRGFAVVASEVRNLASRSANAAKDIKGLVNESVTKVQSGTVLVDRAGQTLLEIVDSVKRVTDLVGEISVASKEQALGIDQVNIAVSQMDAVTQQNASLVEKSSAASRSLQLQADALLREISFFKSADTQGAQAFNEPVWSPPHRDSTPAAAKAKPLAAKQVASKSSNVALAQPAVRETASSPASAPSKPTMRTPVKAAAVSDDDWTEF
ncbi:methyl-accepting chemotaxis protein [Phytohalomonas tamaricis]|uniref:methyl-accepting chemotaxis protein n=1 Tax=Phytohalomonas tamaricis TaxID=2081032 RepID=UPI0021D457E4|nr:methyl-accepting chemotaxis protein [Phytohalomonas tamaricis]